MTSGPGKDPCPFGPEYQVLWDHRYTLFSRFDEARVDAHGLYTMTPESLALDIAARVPGDQVLDVCSGIGAMSIAFARQGKSVTAVEIDPGRMAMARHNARVYGVEDRIRFLTADITAESTLDALPRDLDVVHLDPPWGTGPGEYQTRRVIRMEDLDLAGMDLRALVRMMPCRSVSLRIPKNFDLDSLQGVTGRLIPYRNKGGGIFCYCLITERGQFLRIPGASPGPGPESVRG